MSASLASMSNFLSSDSSGDESVLAHPCRWGWCRELLPTKEALIGHVIQHTMRVVPVRRKDVALMRRIEEGTQQSLRVSLLRDSLPGSAVVSQQHAGSSEQGVHEKSLPSPPHSNGMPHTPASETKVLPRVEPSSSSSSGSSSSEGEQNGLCTSPAKSYPRGSVAATPNPPREQRGPPGLVTPTFASFNSPTNSQASQPSRVVSRAIPDSPPFSSLVKRKPDMDHPQRLSRFNPSSQSRSSTGSTGSQMSVEKQLTQSPRSDVASEASASPHRKNPIHDSLSSPGLGGDITVSQSLYAAELAWDRAQEPDNVFLSQEPSQVVEFELLTQPPSQLQLGTFPFHNHRKSQNFRGVSQAEPASSMPFRPSPPAPIKEKAFAASTPQPQPARRQTRSQSRGPEPAPIQTKVQGTPVRRTSAGKPAPRTPKPKSTTKPGSRSFRSGTLQIPPLALPQPSTIMEETSQQLQHGITAEELLDMHNPLRHFNGSPGQSQSSFEAMDFAELQTQAPYESQPMTQY